MIEAVFEMFASRAYIGGIGLFLMFAASAWFVFFPARRFLPAGIRTSPLRMSAVVVVVFVSALYAGVKPEPPKPPKPPLSKYAKIYARPEFGGSITNGCRVLKPAGALEVVKPEYAR